jgi:hypothetical protein
MKEIFHDFKLVMLIPRNGTADVQVAPFPTNGVVEVKVAKAIQPVFQIPRFRNRSFHYNLNNIASSS